MDPAAWLSALLPNTFANEVRVVLSVQWTMAAIPGNLSTNAQPPMTVPLRHFVVGLAFLVIGGGLGIALAATGRSGAGALAHAHLLLAGWVCITIMGAMTQFVPVWTGTPIHSDWLAAAQLWIVTAGLTGFATTLTLGRFDLLFVFGGVALLGFWTFAYNIARTLASVDRLDVTARHFAFALGFLLVLTSLGFLLALDFSVSVFAGTPVTHRSVRAAHVTLAVFGVVLTTVVGALYQLATMFTQTELHGVDRHLRRFEEIGYPVGVVLLAVGRLVGMAGVARVGGVLVALTLLGFSAVVARRLVETGVPWNPMLRRYAVAAPTLALWALVALLAWLRDPLAPDALFGAPGTAHLLTAGAIGFVVLGTLYHVVPFIVWVHRYSERLGYERVPMIDDLYDDQLARVDLVLVCLGTGALVAVDAFGLPATVAVLGGLAAVVGYIVFAANLLLVLREHSPDTLVNVLFGEVGWDPAGQGK